MTESPRHKRTADATLMSVHVRRTRKLERVAGDLRTHGYIVVAPELSHSDRCAVCRTRDTDVP